MLPEALTDDSRDWTLAHEEMHLAQRLTLATTRRELTVSQQEQLKLCDPARVEPLHNLFRGLSRFYVLEETLSTSSYRQSGEPMAKYDYDLLKAVDVLRSSATRNDLRRHKVSETLRRLMSWKVGKDVCNWTHASHLYFCCCDAYRKGAVLLDRQAEKIARLYSAL